MQFITVFIGRINEKKQEIAEAMVNGNCVNFESYQRLVGQSIGLQEALNVLNDLLEEDNKDVD
jgi:hypothetical protein